MKRFNTDLKPIDIKKLEKRFAEIKEEKKKMDKRNVMPSVTPRVGS